MRNGSTVLMSEKTGICILTSPTVMKGKSLMKYGVVESRSSSMILTIRNKSHRVTERWKEQNTPSITFQKKTSL